MYQARELALSRMQFEADQLGADGVIGVDIKVEFLHNAEWMEVTAIGTAIRWVGSGPHLPPTGQGRVMIPAGWINSAGYASFSALQLFSIIRIERIPNLIRTR